MMRLRNSRIKGRWRFAFMLLLLLSLSACVNVPRATQVESALRYLPEQGEQLLNQQAPVFWITDYVIEHNRIGSVQATSDRDLFIDPNRPVIYAEQRRFSTAKGDYTNLIYRLQFAEVPDGYAPFYLTAGKNVGLLVVITLGSAGQPLLYTTVHTCGCYLAVIPTSYLPNEMYPTGWDKQRQTVFGESLPAYLDLGAAAAEQARVHIRIRPDTHRVSDLWLAATALSPQPSLRIPLQALASLKQVPLDNGETTSFYVDSGPRAGYVKGSHKTRERILMSWWTLDWNIGQDKYLGTDRHDGPVFYTSLKPWARQASDMRDFAKFLHYWGWDL